jgi:lysophospholipase L1-like esterase
VTQRRQRLFLAVTVALPWIFLLLLELGLRAGGYGDSYPLFVRHPSQRDWLVPNPAAAWRWFRGIPFAPTPETEFFRADKARGAFRIVFQGGSSAQGFPYGHGGMPSRMLEQRLQADFPDREIETVNVALTAVNSWTLLDQADEIIAQRPDAVLVYAGHNEWYGALGAASASRVSGTRAVVKAYLLLRHSRVAQLLASVVDALSPAKVPGPGASRTAMQLMAGGQRVPLDGELYERGVAQFRANLSELLQRYRDAGVPVLVGTLASNERDQRPLAAADGPDADSALAFFEQGHRLATSGDTAGARAAWREAKERDALRFRAPEAMNAVIREEAARHGAIVVEVQRALERASPGGTVGASLMLEHLHPNLEGYRIIADAFHDAMKERRMIGPWPAVAADTPPAPVTALDSMVGALRTDRLVSSWPFRPRGAEKVPVVDTLRPRSEVERLARAVVLGELPWAEATERLRVAAVSAGDWETALAAARAMAHEYSWSPEPFTEAAQAAIRLQRWDEALHWARQSTTRREAPWTVQLVGLLMLRLGDHAGAMPWLQRASDLAPRDRRMSATLQAAAMLPALEQRLAEAPRDTAALHRLAAAYAITQQAEKADDAVRRLLQMAPAHAGGRLLRERLAAGSR